jgi:UDP-N-acetylglucosamine--N-acetylmuramyl-(pentapeptide) pyrophosphoryl-undecaprenol N-acetylglucosamine transferase
MKNKIILVGGKTGGPIIPLIAISKKLQNSEFVIYGVKGGFEDRIAKENNLEIKYFLISKLNILTFKNKSIFNLFTLFFDTIVQFFNLFYNICISFYRLIRLQPRMIISAGGFTAVPVCFSSYILNSLGLTKTSIIVHQQDPVVGLTNKIIARFSTLKTCVFEFSKKYKSFSDAKIIPNPINTEIYEESYLKNISTDKNLEGILNRSDKKLLLVMGGGSGSVFINNWVSENLDKLLKNYRVIHLTGLLNSESFVNNNDDYLAIKVATTIMPLLLVKSDIIICRAGMASITELLYLNKTAFLVPIPDSHQLVNAQVVADKFVTLHQENIKNWIEIINSRVQTNASKIAKSDIKIQLESYYKELNSFLV